jgi:hypothetical protein
VDDLCADDSYKKLPFVAGPPHFRFYAGTPLTTENKINIGSFFVLDTEPRSGLTSVEKDALGTLAALAMDFLRVSRQASEGRRAARLSRGLSCFVEGSSSFVDGLGSCRSQGSTRASVSPTTRSQGSRSQGSRSSRGSSSDVRHSRSPVRSQNGKVGTSGSPSEDRAETGTSSDVTTPLPDWLIAGTNGEPDRAREEMHNNHWAFQRAANLIRESLELTGDSGVVFLESSNTPVDSDNDQFNYFPESSTSARVLAMSTGDDPIAPEPESTSTYPAANFERRFLHHVLRRYPKGKIWAFHRDRSLFTSSDDDDKPNPDSPVSVIKTPDSSRGSGKKWRTTETAHLGRYFPNSSQVLFVPLWNTASSQWFAGCFCWNTNETKVFNPSVELTSVMGFGYSIMAEYSRVESVIADRQKGDFIGSISYVFVFLLFGSSKCINRKCKLTSLQARASESSTRDSRSNRIHGWDPSQ